MHASKIDINEKKQKDSRVYIWWTFFVSLLLVVSTDKDRY